MKNALFETYEIVGEYAVDGGKINGALMDTEVFLTGIVSV